MSKETELTAALERLGDLSQFEGHTPGPWEHWDSAHLAALDSDNRHRTSVLVLNGDGDPGVETEFEFQRTSDRSVIEAAPDLLIEVKALRAENERLRAEIDELSQHLADYKDAASSEAKRVDELTDLFRSAKAENERLREVVFGWREDEHPEGFCRATAEYIANRARAALEAEGGE